MMRLLLVISTLVWMPAAQGNTMVWFEATLVSGPTGDTFASNLGPGETLGLACDFYASGGYQPCVWQVVMKAALGTGGIVGWSLDLHTAPNNGVSLTNPQIVPGALSHSYSTPGTAGTGPSLLIGAGGYPSVPAPPQSLTLMSFRLTHDPATPDLFTRSIFGGPSTNENTVWANATTGDYEIVQFGPNLPAPAMEGTIGTAPLINLYWGFPEPASLSLLALGGGMTLRRRRA